MTGYVRLSKVCREYGAGSKCGQGDPAKTTTTTASKPDGGGDRAGRVMLGGVLMSMDGHTGNRHLQRLQNATAETARLEYRDRQGSDRWMAAIFA